MSVHVHTPQSNSINVTERFQRRLQPGAANAAFLHGAA